MNPEWLRYYIGAKLNANVEDLDFNPDDFVARVNSDLVGKYVNIASRAASFITKHFGGALGYGDAAPIAREAHEMALRVAEHYETRDFGKAMRELMAYADRINHDFDAHKPWVLAKDTAKLRELQDVCSRALQGFRLLSVLIAPVLPALAERVAREFFGLDRPFEWTDAGRAALTDQPLSAPDDPRRSETARCAVRDGRWTGARRSSGHGGSGAGAPFQRRRARRMRSLALRRRWRAT